MAAYPLVPKNEVGFRIQITSANTDEEIDRLCEVLGELSERFQLQHHHQDPVAAARGNAPQA
jgi:hypothetical protein